MTVARGIDRLERIGFPSTMDVNQMEKFCFDEPLPDCHKLQLPAAKRREAVSSIASRH
jgi:hypothetical protein